jgi:hypothetical protein
MLSIPNSLTTSILSSRRMGRHGPQSNIRFFMDVSTGTRQSIATGVSSGNCGYSTTTPTNPRLSRASSLGSPRKTSGKRSRTSMTTKRSRSHTAGRGSYISHRNSTCGTRSVPTSGGRFCNHSKLGYENSSSPNSYHRTVRSELRRIITPHSRYTVFSTTLERQSNQISNKLLSTRLDGSTRMIGTTPSSTNQ